VLRRLQRQANTKALTVITTYDGLRKHKDSLLLIEWSGVCLDEGQKVALHRYIVDST
jgi:SNF2 family DNA or RNA helicase